MLFVEMMNKKIQMFRLKIKYLLSGNQNVVKKAFDDMENQGIKNIPIFIISFNRLSYIISIIEYLEKSGYRNIHIIDNNSSYPPLLRYYEEIPYEVIKLDYNGGHMVFWNDSRFEKYRNSFYVLTDPDILPVEECPDDFLEKWFNILKKYPYVRKVGFSLRIDDLPTNAISNDVTVNWEKQFWNIKINEDNMYYADIDTTMALYMPDNCNNANFYRAFRTGFPYQARHLPWYKTVNDITEEDVYYSKLNKFGTWDIPKDYEK